MQNPDPRFDLAHLSRVELETPDPDGTLWFFTELLGMYETGREGASVFLRGYEDPYPWSLKITEGPQPRLGRSALCTSSPAALERRVAVLREGGADCRWEEGEHGYGPGCAVLTPDGHAVTLHWEVEKYRAPSDLASKILTRPSRKPLKGVPVKRLDHLNLMAHDVTAVKRFFEDGFGMQTRERVVDNSTEIGAWLSSNALGHEVAIMRDNMGGHGRLHHVAFFYGVPQHNIDAAEMFREWDVRIEAGPDKHGITQGSFLYVFEPGGNRIELFGDTGILEFEPDFETRTWAMSDIDTGMAIGGANLPWETYFMYGTPPLPSVDGESLIVPDEPAAVEPVNS